MASPDAIRAEVRLVLKDADLEVITSRRVRQQVGERLQVADIDEYRSVIEDEVKAFLEEQSADPLPSLTPVEKRKGSPADPEDQRPAKTRPPIAAEQHEFKLSQDRKAIRKVVVRQYNGRQLIDIREFYEKDGDERPGQKGLALSASQWATLRCHIEDIQQAVKDENCEYLLELGNNRRATVGAYKDSLNINLREYYDKGGELAPGKKGIALSVEEWQELVSHADSINAAAGGPKAAPASGSQAAAGPSSAAPTAAEAVPSAADGDAQFVELSQNRRLSLSDYKGVTRLDLREYYSKDGQMLPGKKGISLTKEQAAKLVAAITELSTALAEKQEKTVTLGPLRYARVGSYKGTYNVNVREFYEKDGKELPGQKGLSMTAAQWDVASQHLPTFLQRM